MSLDEPVDEPTADDVVRSIRDILRLEEARQAQPRGSSRFRRLSEEIGRRARHLMASASRLTGQARNPGPNDQSRRTS
jgi:endonuclease/exonuclease/phosphatase family metal-dependent hydrolase